MSQIYAPVDETAEVRCWGGVGYVPWKGVVCQQSDFSGVMCVCVGGGGGGEGVHSYKFMFFGWDVGVGGSMRDPGPKRVWGCGGRVRNRLNLLLLLLLRVSIIY